MFLAVVWIVRSQLNVVSKTADCSTSAETGHLVLKAHLKIVCNPLHREPAKPCCRKQTTEMTKLGEGRPWSQINVHGKSPSCWDDRRHCMSYYDCRRSITTNVFPAAQPLHSLQMSLTAVAHCRVDKVTINTHTGVTNTGEKRCEVTVIGRHHAGRPVADVVFVGKVPAT